MASAKRKNNVSRKKLRYRDLSRLGRAVSRALHAPLLATRSSRRRAPRRPCQTDRDHERALYTLPRRERHAACFRFSLPTPRHAAFRRLGRRRLDPLYVSWLAVSTAPANAPSNPPRKNLSPAKIRIRNCPTREYLGLIFAYFGEGEAPPFPRYPHMEDEGVLEVLSTEIWPCNFFQRIDNNGDTYHVPFVHRGAYSASSDNNRSGLPEISKEESPWGTTGYASFSQGWRNVFQFFMPNVYAFRNPSPEPECGSEDRMQWDVPLDDEHSLEFRLRRLPLTGPAASEYRARAAAAADEPKVSVAQMGQAVLSGKLSFQDLDHFFKDKISLVHTQDFVSQVGQGSIAERAREHLGRSDVGVILFRKIWERELRALAEGRPAQKMGLAPRRRNKVPGAAGKACPERARVKERRDKRAQ